MKKLRKLTSILFLFFSVLVPTSQAFAVGATLSLSPATGTFNQGCTFSLAVNLDTGGSQTDGTDVILFYDPARFTATNIRTGSIYQDYPTTDLTTPGTVKVSGLASVGSTFSGSGVIANVDFKVLPNAPSDSASIIRFDFDPNNKGKTNDSNVAEHGTVQEILNQVVNGSYNIGTSPCGTTAPAVTPVGISSASGGLSSQTFIQPTPTFVPRQTLATSGAENQTMVLAVIGGSLLVMGILGLAIL